MIESSHETSDRELEIAQTYGRAVPGLDPVPRRPLRLIASASSEGAAEEGLAPFDAPSDPVDPPATEEAVSRHLKTARICLTFGVQPEDIDGAYPDPQPGWREVEGEVVVSPDGIE